VNLPGHRRVLLLVPVLIVLDWASKLWVLNHVALGDTLAVVDGWFYLAHRQNTGVAFSLLSGLPMPWGPLLLAGFSIAVVGFLFRLLTATEGFARVALALVIAGALANAGDRLVNGSVTDFVLVAYFPYVFNLADAAITMGGVMLAISILLGERAATAPASATTTTE
jgi:signal peptidase II